MISSSGYGRLNNVKDVEEVFINPSNTTVSQAPPDSDDLDGIVYLDPEDFDFANGLLNVPTDNMIIVMVSQNKCPGCKQGYSLFKQLAKYIENNGISIGLAKVTLDDPVYQNNIEIFNQVFPGLSRVPTFYLFKNKKALSMLDYDGTIEGMISNVNSFRG